jgi:hypothetical protein
MYKALENRSHCSKKISTLTVGKFIEIRKEVFDDERIFDYSFIEIGKLFLSKILEINTEQSNFKDIRNEYIESSKNKEISELEIDFYKDICFKYLSLEKEPKETLFNSYRQVTKDLEEIEKNILYINSEIKKLENKKQSKDLKYNIEDRYYSNQLSFYKEKNFIAKNEIIDFLVKDIKNDAIKKSQKESFSSYQFTNLFNKIMPYRFSKAPLFNSLKIGAGSNISANSILASLDSIYNCLKTLALNCFASQLSNGIIFFCKYE